MLHHHQNLVYILALHMNSIKKNVFNSNSEPAQKSTILWAWAVAVEFLLPERTVIQVHASKLALYGFCVAVGRRYIVQGSAPRRKFCTGLHEGIYDHVQLQPDEIHEAPLRML